MPAIVAPIPYGDQQTGSDQLWRNDPTGVTIYMILQYQAELEYLDPRWNVVGGYVIILKNGEKGEPYAAWAIRDEMS